MYEPFKNPIYKQAGTVVTKPCEECRQPLTGLNGNKQRRYHVACQAKRRSVARQDLALWRIEAIMRRVAEQQKYARRAA